MPSPPMSVSLTIAPAEFEGRMGDNFVAQLKLSNQGKSAVVIEWFTDPKQYLELEVVDSLGKNIAAFPFSSVFSPISQNPQALRLGPKQSYSSKINLLANVDPKDIRPGIYEIRGTYLYPGIMARSNPVKLVIR
jgi:hypothetical protein